MSSRPERAQGELEGLARRDRLLADRPGGDLDVLVLDGVDDVRGRQAPRGQLVRVEPEAHAVIALTEHDDVADPLEAEQLVLDLDGGEIAHVDAVVAAVRRGRKVDHQQDAGRLLLGVDALACTCGGSWGRARATRFCTSTWAMFTSVPISNVTVSV